MKQGLRAEPRAVNPFAEPVDVVDVEPARPPRRPKPLSLWAAQLALGLQAPLLVTRIVANVREGNTNAFGLWLLSFLAASTVAIAVGIQRRRRWAQSSMTAMLSVDTLALAFVYLLSSPDTVWAQDQLGLRLEPSGGVPLGSVTVLAALTVWACLGKRSREYFRTEASG